MEFKIVHLDETDSTNGWLRKHPDDGNVAVWTDFQTAGRGCGTNSWESQRGQNLLFSLLIHPTDVPVREQFHISMAISLTLIKVLQHYTDGLSIKWPNDIYWRDRKLAGILIENSLSSNMLRDCIIGVGLNVNQTRFESDAPNPVSLRQITGASLQLEPLLKEITNAFTLSINGDDYRRQLFRREGFHAYKDCNGTFLAELVDVEDDGHLLLRDVQARLRRYAFKEVQFIQTKREKW